MATEQAASQGPSQAPNDARWGQLGREAVRSFVWAAISFGGNRFVVFVSTLVLARLLAPRDFGVVAAGLAVIAYLEVALDLGVTSALIYEQERGVTDRVQTAFTLNIFVSALLFMVGLAAAPGVARFFRVPGEENIFRALSLFLLIRGAGQVHDTILKRDLLFRKRTLVELLRAVVRAGLAIWLALLGYEAWSIVWGFLAGELAGTVVSWFLVSLRPSWSLDRVAARTLLKFGFSVVGIKILGEIGTNADYLVVGNRLGPDELGFYSIAFRLPELFVGNIFWIFSSVAFPLYSKTRALGSTAFRTSMLRALTFATLFGFPIGAGLAIVARDAVLVLFSSKWAPAIVPMALISIAFGVGSVGFASGDIFPALGKPGALLKIDTPLTVILVVAFVLAAPYGITAVAWVHLVISLLYAMVRLVVANRLVGSSLPENFRAMRAGLCATAGVVALALPVRLATTAGLGALLLTVLAGSVGGLVGLLASGRSSVDEVRSLARQVLSR
ncbi:MAG: lipopolysaccharide biosynthesis protein [Actinomycetota bacterium]|nr:lipopolysaccharide biosynthesis protein [Actinomycetota bacterium]